MKKTAIATLLIVLITSTVYSMPDIQFSPSGQGWYYDGNGTFSFEEMIPIDLVLNDSADPLTQCFIRIPDLLLQNNNGIWTVTPDGDFQIITQSQDVLLSADMGWGDFNMFFTTSVLYTQPINDLTITSLSDDISSEYLSGLAEGSTFDLNLTMQYDENFADFIADGREASNGFSGSLILVPEPCSAALLLIGTVLLKRKRDK